MSELTPELSYAQQRLWFFNQLMPGSAAYNMGFLYSISGPLDVACFHEALNEIWRRHEALRINFTSADGEPRLVRNDTSSISLPVVDISDWAVSDLEERTAEIARQDALAPFDLAADQLVRVRILRRSGQHHYLILVVHHIVMDGWSMRRFWQELSELYRAFRIGQPSPLEPLQIQYSDYAAWHNRWINGAAAHEHRLFWKELLRDSPLVTSIEGSRERPASLSGRAGRTDFTVGAATTRLLLETARRHQATPFMVLLTIFHVLLAQYNGRSDVITGSPIAGRIRPELENVIGFFINAVPIRTRWSGDPVFTDLLTEVRNVALQCYEHSDIPFERIVADLSPDRIGNRNPVFQIAFDAGRPDESGAIDAASLPGLDVQVLRAETDTTRFDMEVRVATCADELHCSILYSADIYQDVAVNSFAANFLALLTATAAHPGSTLSALRAIAARDRHPAMLASNRTLRPVPGLALPRLFEEQAARTPTATAVRDRNGQITYGDLNAEANRLARCLVRVGLGAEQVAAIMMPPSPELAVSILAVIKAGGAYLLIEADEPPARRADIFRQAGVSHIIGLSQALAQVRSEATIVSVDADEFRQAMSQADGANLTDADRARPLLPANALWVRYVSGSDGRVKPVVLPHSAVANYLTWAADTYVGMASTSCLLPASSPDVTADAILCAITSGGELVLAADDGENIMLDSAAWPRLRRDGDGAAVRTLVLEGGQVPAGELASWMGQHPGAAVVSVYNLAEVGPACTALAVGRDTLAGDGLVPLGYPIWNTRAYVLDAALQPAPLGTTGELYLAGSGLARGYGGPARRTAQSFIADPFGAPGARMYRTGALAAWGKDGVLEYAGRIDDQVTVGGLRLEPAEVESVLAGHRAVDGAAVAYRGDGDRGGQLVAYVVLSDERATVSAWRDVFESDHEATESCALGTDFTGWRNSYDGGQLPLEDMEKWRDETVRRILELKPANVLEIGVGAGLILSAIAPTCSSYWGIDISAPGIARLRSQVRELPQLDSRVTLLELPANQIDTLPAGHFDTIIINSVAQYFPSGEYLAHVTRQAVSLLAPAGAIMVGDIRNLRTVRYLMASIAASQDDQSKVPADIRAAVDERMLREEELLVDPDFFARLPSQIPELCGVDVRMKLEDYDNEVSRHRYDVVLHKVPKHVTSLSDIAVLDAGGGIEKLKEAISGGSGSAVRLTNLLNPRLWPEVRLTAALDSATDASELSNMVDEIARSQRPPSLRDITQACRARGYVPIATCANADQDDMAMEIICLPLPAGEFPAISGTYRPARVARSEALFTNIPASGQAVMPDEELAEHLATLLPPRMRPDTYERLSALPVGSDWRVDRSALPAPRNGTPLNGTDASSSPEMSIADRLAGLFAEVLGVPGIGTDENFFKVGGNSLLAVRLASRIRASLGVELPLRVLFAAPTARSLSTRIEKPAAPRPELAKMRRPSLLPLSHAQQQLWFIHRLEGPSATYNMPLVLRITGPLDVPAMQAAVRDIVARHEPLRTILPEHEGSARQVVLTGAASEPAFEIVRTDDLGAEGLLAEAGRYGFDLTSEPPFRATLFMLGAEKYILLLLLHHIAADGWSMAPLLNDLSAAYAARRQSRPPGFASLPVQYADYALWQAALLSGENDTRSAIAKEVAYWTQTLRDMPTHLPLPWEKGRPPVATYRGSALACTIDSALHRSLRLLAERSGVTMFMVLHAAVAVVVSWLGGGTDVPLGTAVAGRTEEGLGDLVGFFVNTLVLRLDLSGEPTFSELLSRVRNVDLAAQEHQLLPFRRLVQLLNPRRSLGSHPLFQIAIGLDNTSRPELKCPGLNVEHDDALDVGTAKVDLIFHFREHCDSAGIETVIEYASDLLERDTVKAICDLLVQVLAAAAADTGQRTSIIKENCAAGLERVLAQWQATAAIGPGGAFAGAAASPEVPEEPERCLHERFSDHAALAPGAIALIADHGTLTYGELNSRSNKLARHLAQYGVGRGSVVGVLIPRGLDLVVAQLAVLKAGAAYTMLDPEFPARRLRAMVEEVGSTVVITQHELIHLCSRLPVSAVEIDVQAEAIARQPAGNLPTAARYDDVACVMFTSGSSGRPKAVASSHRAIALTLVNQDLARFGRDDVFLQCGAVTWDVAALELFGALIFGSPCVLQPGQTPDPTEIARLVQEHHPTTLWLPTGLFNAMADTRPEVLGHVRQILTGGDVASVTHMARVCSRFPDLRVINCYGLVECPNAGLYRVRPSDAASSTVPIGGPAWHTRLYVLDESLRPARGGDVGDLYIAGPRLAEGYMSQPALTAERFVADPFGAPGERLYRTGDRARWVSEGNLEFVGRADAQLKIRGFRVEPGDVELAICRDSRIARAAVVGYAPRPGDMRLVAYVVTSENISAAQLRERALEVLPEYMVPAAFVVLDTLPLTATGKVDRARLPVPRWMTDKKAALPRTPQEEVLCGLFADVLGRQSPVGIDDGFFEIGGHSLLIIELISKIRETLGAELTVRSVFQMPTVRELGGALFQGSSDSGLEVLLPLRSSGRGSPLFCVHPGVGISWCYSGLMRTVGRDHPIYGLQAPRLSQETDLPASIEEMAAAYISRLRSVQPHGPYNLMGWSFGGAVAHEMAVQLQQQGDTVGLLAMLDCHLPKGPLALDDSVPTDSGSADSGRIKESLREDWGIRLEFSDAAARAIYATIGDNGRLFVDFRPKKVAGDLLFFDASAPDGTDPEPWLGWAPHVAGQIRVIPVNATHDKMTDAPALDEIGKVINDHLGRGLGQAGTLNALAELCS